MRKFLSKIIFVFIVVLFTKQLFASELQHIGNEELNNLLQEGVAVVDVRTTSEWHESGVIKDSHLIMFFDEKGTYDLNAWLSKVSDVANKNEPLVLICHSGSRSKQLAKYLISVVGYEKVYNVKRGIQHWLKHNNHVVVFQ